MAAGHTTGRPPTTAGRGHTVWTAKRDAELLRLHAEGFGCNQIARIMDLGSTTIHERAVTHHGLSFDRSQVEAANIARTVDARARRQAVTDRIYGVLDDTLSHVEAAREGGTGFKTHIKGEHGSDVETTLDFVPPTNRKDLSASIVQLVNASSKLEALDTDNGNQLGRSLLEGLAAAFGIGPVDHGEDVADDPA